MNDTSLEMEAIVAERYRRLSSHERMKIASSMFETARVIVESSLPSGSSRRERRLAFARRLYEGELPRPRCLSTRTGRNEGIHDDAIGVLFGSGSGVQMSAG